MTRNELLEFYKTERTRFEKTRDIQWKFNIALWTLLALAISFLKPETIGKCYCLLFIALILFISCHLLFAILTQRGLIGSRTLSNNILDALDRNNDNEIEFGERRIYPLRWTTNDYLWIIFQTLGSVMLILVLIMKLTASNG
jgi:hypothetical protein